MKRTLLFLIVLSLFFNVKASYSTNNNDNNSINKLIINENRFEKLIYLASTYTKINPEFAFNCAQKANDIASVTNNNKQIAESYIVMGDIFNRDNTYSTAINYYEKAIEKLILTKDYNKIYTHYIKIADLYEKIESDPKRSIDAMKNALIYAQMTKNDKASIETYLNYADIYLSHNDYNNALDYYDKVLTYGINNNIAKDIARTLTSKAYIYINKRDYQEALCLIDSSLNLCKTIPYDILLIKNYGFKAEVHDSLKKYDKAKEYYRQAIEIAYNNKYYNECGEYMYKIGKINMKLKQTQSAIEVFQILCDSTEKFKMYDICYNSYYEMSKCYADLGDYEKAYHFFEKYDVCNDSAMIAKQEKKIEEIHKSYLLSLNIEEMRANKLELNNTKSKKINTIVSIATTIVIIILAIALIFVYVRNKYLYHKNLETTYEQQLKINKMENDLMEIQLKNNKESLINMALHLKSYIDFINPLKNELKEIIDSPEQEQKGKIKNIYMNMQNNTCLFNNTENLNKQIDDIYKDFLERLEHKYPGITKAEKRLCAMLYINMSSKEIAVISNTTLRSVETSRYRLRKKFNLSRDEDIVNFLKSI